MRRETATQARDLPHEFANDVDADDPHDTCILCGEPGHDARHLAWARERAMQQTARPAMARELGT